MKIEELVDLKDPTERIGPIKSRYAHFERIIWKMITLFLVCMYSDQIIHITHSLFSSLDSNSANRRDKVLFVLSSLL